MHEASDSKKRIKENPFLKDIIYICSARNRDGTT